MSTPSRAWNATKLANGHRIIINQPLMVRINRAMRTRRCIECGELIKPPWPGVTCGSKKCMAKWLRVGKGEVEIEPVAIEIAEE